MPRIGTVIVTGGQIRITDRMDVRSHYHAPLAGGGGNTHIFQTTTTTTTRTLPCADVRVWTPDGKQIATATLPQWLSKEYPALISGDGGEVDPLFREVLREYTPIVAVPALPQRASYSAPPPGVVAPGPKVR